MTFRRSVAACTLLVAFLALCLAPPCDAQAPAGPKKTPPYSQGTDAFRRLLFEFGFQPLPDCAGLQQDPSASLFILLGHPGCLSGRFFQEKFRAFVEEGGAVLIATDNKTGHGSGEVLNKLAGVQVTGETFICPIPNAGEIYDESPYCPFVQPIADSRTGMNVLAMMDASVAGSRPALFRNPHPQQPDLRVATNAPSRLKESIWGLPDGIHRLARLPATCLKEKTNRHVFELPPLEDKKGALFAVGGTIGKGRVLVLADHSIFINRMILPTDNGNLEFAANCLNWLRGGVSSPVEALRAANSRVHQQLAGQRNKVLFWDDGQLRLDRRDFELPLKKISMPPAFPSESAIVATLDKTVAKLEENDFFNRKILEAIDDTQVGRAGVLRIAMYILTLAAVLLLSYLFLWRIRYQWESSFPFLTEAIGRHQPKLSVLDQRRRALLRSGNVWEMGHRLAREYFEAIGVALTTDSPPRIQITQGGWRQRWRIRRRLARLWRLARGDAPAPLSPAALEHCLRHLEELKTALANGTIQLT